ncbi:MAG TPA: BrnA antitoxin family protein [Longimicrobiales bacterium]|nr:BrnA antitoxin family protein [Longimicrobiales bacterium]
MKKRSTESTSRGGRRRKGREKKLVRTTSGELARMADATDWEQVEGLTDADIEGPIADDPDAAPVLDDAFWRNAEILDPRHEKSTITMRVDDDVLDFFKRGGSGYQSRMNAVLRAYVYARRQKAQ